MRYLNLGTRGYAESQAVYHALAELADGDGEMTLVTVSPDQPYVCVGYHQFASREIDREYCERAGIPVGRRMVGGGAVYLDFDQIFWHLILPGARWPIHTLYERVLPAPVSAYRAMGIAAAHRPVNDIVVGPRKIGGTGAATLGGATVVVGSILMDFDTRAMAHVLRVPSEKFRDKMVSSLDDYMTTVRRELGDMAPSREEATQLLVSAFAEAFDEEVRPDRLTEEETEHVGRYAARLFDPAFVYRDESGWITAGVKIREGVRLYEGIHKAPGGLIRLIFRERDHKFDDIVLSGDFFMEPADGSGLKLFQQQLVGRPLSAVAVGEAAAAMMQAVTMAGVTQDDIVRAFENARAGSLVNPGVGQ